MNDNVLTLFEGLTRDQVKVMRLLAVPVLRELRTAVKAGTPRLIIDLDRIPRAAPVTQVKTGEKATGHIQEQRPDPERVTSGGNHN